ncbi:MAG: endo-1,4-beta-xylanase [Clostridia bacterium]|nr:endo-1,4-beta-xylanase [Clostridia bacterium]
MKIGASIGFQLIHIFNIIENPDLTETEKRQEIEKYQRSLTNKGEIKNGIPVKEDKGQNTKEGFYVLGNVDEMDYESLLRTKEYVDNVLTSFTCEGEMKMTSTIAGYDKENHRIEYNFSFADEVYGYAMKHGKAMRGHTLVWHKHEPEALDKYIEDRLGCSLGKFREQYPEEFYQRRKELTKDFLSEYIKTMGEHYPNCYCWDVLNEIVPDMHTGQPTEQERKDGIRHSKWMEYLGEEFYIDVLEIARANLPKGTKLFYNEYGEQHPEKRKAILEVIEKIKQYEQRTGKTILDGIGLQSHYDAKMTPEQIEEIHRDFAATGKEIQITEVDITPGRKDDGITPEEYNPNNPIYENLWKKVYECARKYGIEALTCWGVNDDLSWFSSLDIGCTMIDKNGVPKEYAQKFLDEIKREQQREQQIEKIIFFHDQKSDRYYQDMRTGRYSISEQEIGKATVNIPTTQKSAAQKHVTRDEQELEQGITKEN